RGYVQREVEQLVAGTRRFGPAYQAGGAARARARSPPGGPPRARIEPVAESFGDLDPKMDLREADLEQGQTWTGWHLLEKDLWWPRDEPTDERLTDDERARYADQLLADTHDLRRRVQRLDYSPDQIANGAKELLDEIATGKVTGEEEAWSHTDLYDFQANVDGARVAFDSLRAIVDKSDPALGRLIEKRFDALRGRLDQHRTDDGFVAYTALAPDQVKDLADAVNALAEPLSRLTAAVVTA
ncbi:MAG: iron uptake system protein EfeO, partial [Nocardioidaceae bacterium]